MIGRCTEQVEAVQSSKRDYAASASSKPLRWPMTVIMTVIMIGSHTVADAVIATRYKIPLEHKSQRGGAVHWLLCSFDTAIRGGYTYTISTLLVQY